MRNDSMTHMKRVRWQRRVREKWMGDACENNNDNENGTYRKGRNAALETANTKLLHQIDVLYHHSPAVSTSAYMYSSLLSKIREES